MLVPNTSVRPRKLAARRARHRPVRCSQWVSGWLGSPWGRALGAPTRHFKPHEPSGDAVPSAGRGSCRLRRPMRPQGSLRRGELATGPSTAPLVPQPPFWCAHCLLKAVGAVGRRSHTVWGAATTGVDRGGALYSAPERAAERGRARPSAVHRGWRLTAAHRDIAQVTLLILGRSFSFSRAKGVLQLGGFGGTQTQAFD